jgi:hypothetical protein
MKIFLIEVCARLQQRESFSVYKFWMDACCFGTETEQKITWKPFQLDFMLQQPRIRIFICILWIFEWVQDTCCLHMKIFSIEVCASLQKKMFVSIWFFSWVKATCWMGQRRNRQ